MSEAFISINELHYRYLADTPVETVALRGVNMEIRKGEITVITGPSGAGKSTLLMHCNGLLRPRDVGHVLVAGQDLGRPDVDIRRVRQMVGLVFQHPERQLFERLVGDDVAFGPKKLGLARAEVRERVQWAMETAGLDFERYVDRPTSALSGGERRKAALAGVLALRPAALALDETTAGLDPLSRESLLELIGRLNGTEGMTIILVTSDLEGIVEMAHQVVVLAEGRTVMSGLPSQLFSRAGLLDESGIGRPATNTILVELAQLGHPIDPGVIGLPAALEEICKILPSCAT